MPEEFEDDDEPLEVFWDDLRVSRHRVPPQPGTDEWIRSQVEPGDLAIGTSGHRILTVIKPNGQLVFGPEYKPDEAAMIFWEAIGRRRYDFEERILLIQHMEAILTRLGAADMRLEEIRLRVTAGDPEAGAQAGGAQVALERLMSQAIELGRGLARRPEMPVPDLPSRVPDQIRQNPQSEYQGRDGIDPDPQDPPTGG